MTNTTPTQSILQTENIADLHKLWKELTAKFGNDPAGMTTHHKAVGGKLFALCMMKGIPNSSTIDEIREVTEALISLGCSSTPQGQGLISSALMKWRTLCITSEEAAEVDAMIKALISI